MGLFSKIWWYIKTIASEQHRGHIFIDISEVYEESKSLLENNVRKLEETTSPQYKEKALFF